MSHCTYRSGRLVMTTRNLRDFEVDARELVERFVNTYASFPSEHHVVGQAANYFESVLEALERSGKAPLNVADVEADALAFFESLPALQELLRLVEDVPALKKPKLRAVRRIWSREIRNLGDFEVLA